MDALSRSDRNNIDKIKSVIVLVKNNQIDANCM